MKKDGGHGDTRASQEGNVQPRPPAEDEAPSCCAEGLTTDSPEALANEIEEEELKRLHADVLVRFHLRKPSPESDDEAVGGQGAPSLADNEIDPELGELDPGTGGVHCKVCDRPLNSKAQFKDHLKGQKHFKKTEQARRKKERDAQAAQAAATASPLLTIRTVTCTSDEEGVTQLWGAYVPTPSYQ